MENLNFNLYDYDRDKGIVQSALNSIELSGVYPDEVIEAIKPALIYRSNDFFRHSLRTGEEYLWVFDFLDQLNRSHSISYSIISQFSFPDDTDIEINQRRIIRLAHEVRDKTTADMGAVSIEVDSTSGEVHLFASRVVNDSSILETAIILGEQVSTDPGYLFMPASLTQESHTRSLLKDFIDMDVFKGEEVPNEIGTYNERFMGNLTKELISMLNRSGVLVDTGTGVFYPYPSIGNIDLVTSAEYTFSTQDGRRVKVRPIVHRYGPNSSRKGEVLQWQLFIQRVYQHSIEFDAEIILDNTRKKNLVLIVHHRQTRLPRQGIDTKDSTATLYSDDYEILSNWKAALSTSILTKAFETIGVTLSLDTDES